MNLSVIDNEHNTAAHMLAISFIEEADLPSRYKKDSKSKKINMDSSTEKSFQNNVHQWRKVIDNILISNDDDMAWRFINLAPNVQPGTSRITDCTDFLKFNDYLMHRRDVENCSSDELGRLSMLLGAFQREIEKVIS